MNAEFQQSHLDTCPQCGGPATLYDNGHYEALTDEEAMATIRQLKASLQELLEFAWRASDAGHIPYAPCGHAKAVLESVIM